jgi:hypothetical protein
MSGLTGPIEFDSYGRRKTFILDLVELTQNGMEQVSARGLSASFRTMETLTTDRSRSRRRKSADKDDRASLTEVFEQLATMAPHLCVGVSFISIKRILEGV